MLLAQYEHYKTYLLLIFTSDCSFKFYNSYSILFRNLVCIVILIFQRFCWELNHFLDVSITILLLNMFESSYLLWGALTINTIIITIIAFCFIWKTKNDLRRMLHLLLREIVIWKSNVNLFLIVLLFIKFFIFLCLSSWVVVTRSDN